MSHFLISAAHKSSGKTTISIGLCAALKQQGYDVTPFKKGPDYIDPMWLAKAAGKTCHNLDFHTMDADEIIATVHQQAKDSDFVLIEGNKGLYDGLDLHGSNSNAALASLLHAPIILIIDARGMTRGIAPLILGYQAFDSQLDIAGVILNKLGGARHESKLRAVIQYYTNVPIIGAVHRNKQLQMVERHLGLIPSNESSDATSCIKQIARLIEQQIDIEAVKTIANKSQLPNYPVGTSNRSNITNNDATSVNDIRIGIAQDTAFGFYYPGDLDAFAECGAKLVPFDTLQDKKLPPCDALFIGGGFPEIKMIRLEANLSLREDIKLAIEKGLPVYAECGGLMYLTRSISWQGKRCDMVGAIPADTIMHERPQGRGYVRLQETQDNPWPVTNNKQLGYQIAAHEFHYSSLENYSDNFKFAYQILRGTGIDGNRDGIIYNNVLGCYSHLRNVKANPWVSRFVNHVRNIKSQHQTNN